VVLKSRFRSQKLQGSWGKTPIEGEWKTEADTGDERAGNRPKLTIGRANREFQSNGKRFRAKEGGVGQPGKCLTLVLGTFIADGEDWDGTQAKSHCTMHGWYQRSWFVGNPRRKPQDKTLEGFGTIGVRGKTNEALRRWESSGKIRRRETRARTSGADWNTVRTTITRAFAKT